MVQVQSFAPIVGRQPRVLILGSMPGVASLEAVQYYAHPRNAFWPIMAELFDFDASLDYADRISRIETLPVILWDSLRACHRPGSLDSSIDSATAMANDFPTLLEQHAQICAIAFNGATSEKYFRKLALPVLPRTEQITLMRMPSTSPANAGMSFAQKLEAWRRILDFV